MKDEVIIHKTLISLVELFMHMYSSRPMSDIKIITPPKMKYDDDQINWVAIVHIDGTPTVMEYHEKFVTLTAKNMFGASSVAQVMAQSKQIFHLLLWTRTNEITYQLKDDLRQ